MSALSLTAAAVDRDTNEGRALQVDRTCRPIMFLKRLPPAAHGATLAPQMRGGHHGSRRWRALRCVTTSDLRRFLRRSAAAMLDGT